MNPLLTPSNNEQVTRYLADLELSNPEHFTIFQHLRALVFEICPTASEQIKYGGILFSTTESFGGIFSSRKHVSFEFSNGALFTDPENVLEGTGKYRRHLTIKSLDEITKMHTSTFIPQAVSRITC